MLCINEPNNELERMEQWFKEPIPDRGTYFRELFKMGEMFT